MPPQLLRLALKDLLPVIQEERRIGSKPIWSLNLLDTTNPAQMSAGQLAFAVPPGAVPAAEVDLVYWEIVVDADLETPSAIQDSFPIRVISPAAA